MPVRPSVVAAVAAAGLTVTAPAAMAAVAVPSAPKDYAKIALDIVPSGNYGTYPPPANADVQARMYDGLTPLFNHVSAAQLRQFFKPETLGSDTAGPGTAESVPHPGVTVIRDSYDIPHIIATTRDALTWASGWVEAEDQGLLLEEARYDSLLSAIDAPGLSGIDLIGSLQTFQPTQQTETEVAKQTAVLQHAGREGRAVLHDLRLYLAGINAYLKAHGSSDKPFTLTDIYAFNALKDQFVGEGGGRQAANGEFLSALQHRLGARRGFKVWNDLREANDPEAPASVPGTVRFQPPPSSMSGNVMLDAGSLTASAAQDMRTAAVTKHYASNALIVAGWRSSTHHPIMVAGPQIGYFYPGLTTEVVEQAPGIDQRGVTSAPFPGYIFIGRSQDSGWSLTSAGLDQITTYADTLCGHSIHRYVWKGHCRAMQYFDAGTLNPGTARAQKVAFWRTVHGPVFGYAHVHGRLVALDTRRASYGKDVLDLLFYYKLAHGQVHNVHQFFRAAALTPQTFNSLYVDDKDIGVYTSGLVPIQPRNVDQDLPVLGNGTEEWRGYVSAKNHPQGINPPNGEIVNWNNRTQRGYQAPDDNWVLGAVQRVSLLLRNLGYGRHVTPAHVVSAMNAAATQDVREVTVEPLLSKLLRTGRAPNARDAKMLDLLNLWYRQGASRLDRTDANGMGNITAPGAAIMDAAWPYLTRAWASSVLGPQLTAQFAQLVSPFDAPPGGQYTGWYVYMNKDLRTILGQRVRGPYAIRYCGGGSLKRCRTLLWRAINQAGNELQKAQGPNPSAWRTSAVPERIHFVPGLLPYTMRYTNRPTGIQQVLSFSGHSPQDTGR